jgi:hypothetical protein
MHIVTERWGIGNDEFNEEMIFMADEIKKRGVTSYASLRKVSKAYNRTNGIYDEEMRELHFYGELKVLYELRLIQWSGLKGRTHVTWIGDNNG